MKKILSLLLSVTLFVSALGMNTAAQEALTPKGTHTYTTTENFASDEWSADQRGVHLNGGTSVITREAVNKINISGATTASHVCDRVVLILNVERSTSYATGYGTYKSYVFDAEDVYQLVKGISNITVERGYYYRVHGIHSVTKDGLIETTDTTTDPLDYR